MSIRLIHNILTFDVIYISGSNWCMPFDGRHALPRSHALYNISLRNRAQESRDEPLRRFDFLAEI